MQTAWPPGRRGRCLRQWQQQQQRVQRLELGQRIWGALRSGPGTSTLHSWSACVCRLVRCSTCPAGHCSLLWCGELRPRSKPHPTFLLHPQHLLVHRSGVPLSVTEVCREQASIIEVPKLYSSVLQVTSEARSKLTTANRNYSSICSM